MKKEYIEKILLDTSEFTKNNYFCLYVDLIINSTTDTYKAKCLNHRTNKHHILPRSYFKYNDLPVDDSGDNLCVLMFKDHILAHYYLYKCSKSDKQKYSNAHAVIHLTRQQFNYEDLDDKFDIKCLDDHQRLYDDYKSILHNILSEMASGSKNGNCQVNLETCDKIKKMLDQGISYDEIQKTLQCPRTVILRISQGKHWSCKEDNYRSPHHKKLEYLRKYKEEHKEDIKKKDEERQQKKFLAELRKKEKLEQEQIWYQSDHYCKNCGKLMLNYHKSAKYGDGIFCSTNCIYSYSAKKRSPDHIKKILANRRSYKGKDNPNFGKIPSEKSRKKMSASQKIAQKGARIMIKGNERRRVIVSKQKIFLQNGYKFLKGEKIKDDKQ